MPDANVEQVADEAYAALVVQTAQSGAAAAMTLDAEVSRLLQSGMDIEKIEEFLLNDLETEGPIFGEFIGSIRRQFDGGVKWVQERVEFAAWDTKAKDLGYDSAEEMLQLWILVSDNPCPDCIERSAMGPRPRAEWVEMGLPGAGGTICGPRCHCHLAPVPKGASGDKVRERVNEPISRKGIKEMAKAKRESKE